MSPWDDFCQINAHVFVVLEPAKRRGVHDPAVGVLMITVEDGPATSAQVWCGFTTRSMAIAFASSRDARPKV